MILVRLILGAMFLVSSWGKLLYPRIFAESLVSYQVLPEGLVTIVAVILPWLELIAGLAMVLGSRHRASALVLGGLSGLFMLVVSSVVWKGLDISCGCFVGVDWIKVNWGHLLLNTLLVVSAGLVYWKGPGHFALYRSGRQTTI